MIARKPASRRWHRRLGTALLCAALAAPLHAQTRKPAERDLVAVLDFEIEGGTKAQASALTSQLRTELLRTGRVILVDRSQMDAILNEQAFQQTGCTSQECAVQVGKILGIRKMITGKLVKLDDNLWQVSVVMTDVETAETLKAESINHDGNYRSLLLTGMAKVAELLTGAAPTQESAAGPRAGAITLIGLRPGDKVTLDGTPLAPRKDGRYLTSAGPHKLTLAREGFRPYEDDRLDVPSGGTAPIAVDSVLEAISGTLTITQVPRGSSAKISGGGEVQTQTVVPLPARRRPLPVGQYEVLITRGDGKPVLNGPVVLTVEEGKDAVLSVAEQATQANKELRTGVGWGTIGVGGGLFGLLAYLNAQEVHDYNTKNKKLVKEMKAATNQFDYDTFKTQYKTNVKLAKSSHDLGQVSAALALLSVGAGVFALATEPSPGFEPVAALPEPFGGATLSLTYRW